MTKGRGKKKNNNTELLWCQRPLCCFCCYIIVVFIIAQDYPNLCSKYNLKQFGSQIFLVQKKIGHSNHFNLYFELWLYDNLGQL